MKIAKTLAPGSNKSGGPAGDEDVSGKCKKKSDKDKSSKGKGKAPATERGALSQEIIVNSDEDIEDEDMEDASDSPPAPKTTALGQAPYVPGSSYLESLPVIPKLGVRQRKGAAKTLKAKAATTSQVRLSAAN
jgi:hypothetical protein